MKHLDWEPDLAMKQSIGQELGVSDALIFIKQKLQALPYIPWCTGVG